MLSTFQCFIAAGFKRPVVVFGPLADVARERLAGDYYDVYEIARKYSCLSWGVWICWGGRIYDVFMCR